MQRKKMNRKQQFKSNIKVPKKAKAIGYCYDSNFTMIYSYGLFIPMPI